MDATRSDPHRSRDAAVPGSRSERRSRGGNHDIWVSTAALADHARVRYLIEDGALERAFLAHDVPALQARTLHHSLGLLSLALGTTALLLAVASLWDRSTGREILPDWLDLVAFVSAVLPLCVAVALWFFKTHSRWLRSRFCAERIRQWRFHQFLDGDLVESADYADRAGVSRARLLEALESVDASAAGSQTSFVSRTIFSPDFPPTPYTDPDVFGEAMRAYKSLRLDYQTDYFTGMEQTWAERDLKSRFLARWLLIAALPLLALEGFVVSTTAGRATDLETLLPAAALALAILSISVRVYRSGAAVAEEAERYASRSIQLLQLSQAFGEVGRHSEASEAFHREVEHKLRVMSEVERVCWLEFVEFMRTAEKSDYFI